MYTETLKKAERILSLYNEGNNIMEIIEKVGTPTSKKTVKKILLSYGVDYSEKLKERKESIPAIVKQMYSEGKDIMYIQKKLRLTYTTVRDILKSTDIHYRSKSEMLTIRHGYTSDSTVFDILTPEALYWIGILYADGHILKEKGYGVELSLHKDDRELLEKYKRFLKTDRPIIEVPGVNVLKVRFGCERIHTRLRELGFKHDKSYTAEPHELLKDNRDFWRGVVDGDGCLWTGIHVDNGKRQVLNLCGTEATCKGFKEFVNSKGIESEASVRKVKNESTWTIVYENKYARTIIALLYKDAEVYMERKYQKYLEIMNYSL